MDRGNKENQKSHNQDHNTMKNKVLSIVCADDEKLMLDMINYFILDAYPDAEIRQAQDGNAALTCCFAQPPDILVTNVNMPGMTGLN